MTARAATLAWTVLAALGCGDASAADEQADASAADADAATADLGEPLEVPIDEQWHWVPFPEAHCANGSTAGVAVNRTDASGDLAIVFQGGGQCWDVRTCIDLPLAFNLNGLPADPLVNLVKGDVVEKGLWNRADTANPFRDWNYVAVAYCTGDGHIGNRATTYGDTTLQHVGFANTAQYLKRIVPTFRDAPRVLVTGSSAGGQGALGSYDAVARAFQAVGGPLPILIDDAGPVLRAPYMPVATQQAMQQAWGLDATVGARCDTCNPTDGYHNGWFDLARTWPGMRGALLSSQADDLVRLLYGVFNGALGPMSQEQFAAGLADFADYAAEQQPEIAPSATRVFYYPGGRHMAFVGSDISETPGLAPFLLQLLDDDPQWTDVRP